MINSAGILITCVNTRGILIIFIVFNKHTFVSHDYFVQHHICFAPKKCTKHFDSLEEDRPLQISPSADNQTKIKITFLLSDIANEKNKYITLNENYYKRLNELSS